MALLLARTLFFIFDLCLAHMAYHWLKNSLFIQYLDQMLISPYIGDPLYVSLSFTYLIFAFYRLYTAFFLGVNPIEWLSNHRTLDEETAWSLRQKALSYSLLDILLTPVVNNLSLLFSSKSIGEALLDMEYSGSRELRWWFFTTVSFLILPISLASSILNQDYNYPELALSKIEKRKTFSDDQDFSKFKDFSSEKFALTTSSSLENGRYLLLPSFESIKRGKDKVYRNFITIYDQENERVGRWKKGDSVNWVKLINNIKRFDPFFTWAYPELSKLNNEKKSVRLSLKQKEELVTLIKMSLKLTKDNFISHIFKRGPLLEGYLMTKLNIIRLGQRGALPIIQVATLGDSDFLVLKQSLDFLNEPFKGQYETYIPIEFSGGASFIFNWNKDIASAASREEFRRDFFDGAQWRFDNSESVPIEKKNISAFTIADYYTKLEKKEDEARAIEDYLVDYYKGMLLISHKEFARRTWLDLERLYYLTLKINSKEEGHYSKKYIGSLKKLKKKFKIKVAR